MRFPEPDEAVGTRLRVARTAAGKTQRDLAVGVSPAFVAHVERGARRPSMEVLAKIAAAIPSDPHELATGEPDPDRRRIDELEVALEVLEDLVVTFSAEWLRGEDGGTELDALVEQARELGLGDRIDSLELEATR